MVHIRVVRVQARVSTDLLDRREVEAREVRGLRNVQRAAGGRVGLLWQQRVVAAVAATVGAARAQANIAVRPRLGALVAAAARWSEGANPHADHHHALQRHHRHAGKQAAAKLDRDGKETDRLLPRCF